MRVMFVSEGAEGTKMVGAEFQGEIEERLTFYESRLKQAERTIVSQIRSENGSVLIVKKEQTQLTLAFGRKAPKGSPP